MKQTKVLFLIIFMSTVTGLFSLPVHAQQAEGTPLGVVPNLFGGSVQLIDPLTQTLSPQYLKGSMNNNGAILLDTVITSDGKTAIVSNWASGTLNFIDISGGFDTEPVLLGSTFVGLDAQDIAITPDGKFALVTAGSFFTNSIAVVDIASRNHVFTKTLFCECTLGESITVAPDGETVIVTDFWNAYVHTLELRPSGALKYHATYDLWPFWPVNSVVSPDGKTVIIVLGYHSVAPIFSLDSPGELTNMGNIALPGSAGQSCVFSADGTKAYYLCNDPDRRGTEVAILDVTGPGQVSSDGTSIKVLPTRGGGGLFGIETIALDPSGNYIYVTNPSDNPGLSDIAVIDLGTNTQVMNLTAVGIPTGIAFGTIMPDEKKNQKNY